jgi:hypothetical protein
MSEQEKITITIHNLDDVRSVLKSIELLFQKLFHYYAETNVKNLTILVLSCCVWLESVAQKLGLDDIDYEDFKEL